MAKRQLLKLTITFLLVPSLFYSTFAFAEVIILKSGKTIEGKIVEKTDKYIKIDYVGVPVTYWFDDIESIDGARLVSSKDLELQEPLTANTENALDSSYSSFGIFRIRIPEGWKISQKVDSNAGRVVFSREPNAANFYGFMILYSPAKFDASEKIYEERFIRKFEEQSEKFLGKFGDVVTNTRVSKIRFNDMPALQFDADIPRPDMRASQILFSKNGFNFSIVIIAPVSQYDQYRPIIDKSLSTFELMRSNYDFIQQQSKKSAKGNISWIIIAFLCAPLSYYLAKIKNISWPIMWALFGFLLSIIPVIILLIIPKRKPRGVS